MKRIEFKDMSVYTDPLRKGNIRPGTRAVTFRAGDKWHKLLDSGEVVELFCLETSKVLHAIVETVILTYSDVLEELDVVKLQIDPKWRTSASALKNMKELYGSSFGRIMTVVRFEVVCFV